MAKHRKTPEPRRMWWRIRNILLLAATSMAVLAGCARSGKGTEPWNDAPRNRTFENAADVVTMPDGFSNLT